MAKAVGDTVPNDCSTVEMRCVIFMTRITVRQPQIHHGTQKCIKMCPFSWNIIPSWNKHLTVCFNLCEGCVAIAITTQSMSVLLSCQGLAAEALAALDWPGPVSACIFYAGSKASSQSIQKYDPKYPKVSNILYFETLWNLLVPSHDAGTRHSFKASLETRCPVLAAAVTLVKVSEVEEFISFGVCLESIFRDFWKVYEGINL